MFWRKELKSKLSGARHESANDIRRRAPSYEKKRRALVFAALVSLNAIGIFYITSCFMSTNDPSNDKPIETMEERMEGGLLQFFDRKSVEQVDSASSINQLISLRTSGHLQSGFGNIMIGVFGVIMEGFVSDRFPIINNCIILNMFQHPNPSLSFLNSNDTKDDKNNICQFEESQLAKYSPNPNVQDQKHVNNQAIVQDLKKDGIMKMYAPFLQMDEGDPRLYDIVSSAAAKWMMQRPTPIFQSLVDERKEQILSQCHSKNIHLAIQIRTWRDFSLSRGQSYTAVIDPINECISGWLKNMLNTAAVHDTVCVYITSDDPVEIKPMVEKWQDVDSKRLKFAISQPPSQDSWHSKDSFAEHKSNFDPKLLAQHEELIDWMIFGEADAAIYTLGSTFGRTARMRRGYVGQKYDYVVGRSSNGNGAKNPFICSSVQPLDSPSVKWTGLGTLDFEKTKERSV